MKWINMFLKLTDLQKFSVISFTIISYAITIPNNFTALFLCEHKANLLCKKYVAVENYSKNVQKQAFWVDISI